jgi:DNA-binding transcriptional ArsR family regulator/uncharacterized protein YndB with AHSA1/START domain
MSRDDLTPLWKALADPSRRRILDLLRERPRTTGDLCAAFAVSRFAVMKHLRVLEQANLVAVRRRGRERWNHLNGVPLQQLHERWIRPFEAEWASNLLRLQDHVEGSERRTMPSTPQSQGSLGHLVVEQDILIEAPRAKVFDALTGDLSAWWGRPYIQDVSRAQSVVLEPHLGGRFLEKWSDEEGAIWCTVTNLKKNERLILQGSMAMSGAVFGVIRFDLEDAPAGTRLKLSHRAMGEVNPDLQQGYHGGWEDLLQRRLRAWVERGERMGLGHEPPMPDGA